MLRRFRAPVLVPACRYPLQGCALIRGPESTEARMTHAVARPNTATGAYALSFGLLVGGLSLTVGPVATMAPLDTGVRIWPPFIALLTVLLSASAITLQFRRQGRT